MIFLIKELHFSREKKFINICSNLQRAAVQMYVTPTTVRLVNLILQLENLNDGWSVRSHTDQNRA